MSLKYNNNIFLIVSTLVVSIICASQISSLISKSYLFKQADFFKIDSVKMLTRAFITGGGKSSSKSIEFEDEKRRTFSISSSRFDVVSNRSNLFDTLKYSELVITVFTDKEGYDNYYDTEKGNKIEVYDIKVGGTSFINLDDVNTKEHDKRLTTIIFFSLAYVVCVIYYFWYRQKK